MHKCLILKMNKYKYYTEMNRQSWSCDEDEAICSLVAQYGLNDWTKIAEKLKQTYSITMRTGKQCRQRWYNHLNPSVNKKPWDSHQEERLFQLHKIHGNRWKDISRHFTGRTDNDIKNHFYSTLRRSLRRLNKISGQKNSTSQMREIKPSVLSTIMNYIYEQQHVIENDFFRSLKDLPSLIFEFANFKPIKTNLRYSHIDDAKDKISEIFTLIARFNEEYEKNKQEKHHIKQRRVQNKRDSPQKIVIKLNPPQSAGTAERKFCSESTLKQSNQDIDQQQFQEPFNQDKSYQQHQNEAAEVEEIDQLEGALRRRRNMSLDAQEQQEIDMPQLLEPDMNSIMGDSQCMLDLTVVGKHWQPQGWQKQAQLKVFVDQVLEIHYDM